MTNKSVDTQRTQEKKSVDSATTPEEARKISNKVYQEHPETGRQSAHSHGNREKDGKVE
jgi:hypothetical protein